MHRCEWCGVPTESALCRPCLVAIGRQLGTCSWLAGQLDLNVTRQSQSGSRFRDGGRSTEKPLVFDDGASEGAWVLRNTLETWAVCVRDAIRASPADPSTRGLTKWLRWQLGAIAGLSGAADLLGELNSVVSYAFMLIDIKSERLYLGDCTCGVAIYGASEHDEVHCWKCRQVYRTEEWRKANAEAGRELLVSIPEAARYLGEVYGIQATAQRIRRWKPVPVGADDGGVPVYRLGDLLDLARNTSNTLARRRAELLRTRLGFE